MSGVVSIENIVAENIFHLLGSIRGYILLYELFLTKALVSELYLFKKCCKCTENKNVFTFGRHYKNNLKN